MQKIVLIFPYFGKFPPQYKAWRQTALMNSDVDFMFFTDQDVESIGNIIVHHMQFSDFQKLVQDAFDFTVDIDRPYKLCEYKQAYGHILKNYIQGYDFWGFGDIDVVYGDLRSIITEDVLSKYKLINGWGHLSLFHNDEDTNTYFMVKKPGYQYYKDAFTVPDISFFDEFGHKGCSDKWRDFRPDDCWFDWHFDHVTKPKQSYHFNSITRGWNNVIFEHIGKKLYMIRFQDGKMEKLESLYAHFQHRSFMRDYVKDYSHFIVTPERIIDYPKYFTNIRLRFHCRNRNFATKLFRWRDTLIWRLNLTKWR